MLLNTLMHNSYFMNVSNPLWHTVLKESQRSISNLSSSISFNFWQMGALLASTIWSPPQRGSRSRRNWPSAVNVCPTNHGLTDAGRKMARYGSREPVWKPSLPMSHHFGFAKAYTMLTSVEFFLTRSTLRKPLREVLTRPHASEGFAYAKRVMTRPLLKM